MSAPKQADWRIVVTMGMGWDARVEVFDPDGVCWARCAWLPSPSAAFGWGLVALQSAAGRLSQVAAPGAGEAAGPGRAGFDSQDSAPPIRGERSRERELPGTPITPGDIPGAQGPPAFDTEGT